MPARVKKIVVEHLGVDEAKVTPGASFTKDLGADSLDVVELTMAFEEAFGIAISEPDAKKMLTVQDAINFLATHACGNAAHGAGARPSNHR